MGRHDEDPMISIQRILCPVDFSDYSRHAVHHAVALARWYQSTITLLHVQSPVAVPAGPPEVLPTLILSREQRQELLASLKQLVTAEAGDAVPIEVDVAEGNPAREIVDRAKSSTSDLIVMGTHGASGFERLLLGSVTEKVLRKAPCPVMTVPPRAQDVMPIPPLFKRILCAIDFSDASMRALKYAMSLAQEADARLTVVHAFELEGTMPENWRNTLTPPSIRKELVTLEQERRDKLAQAVPDSVRSYCEVETAMVSGTPYREILQLAEQKQSELIVLGVHGRSAADLFFFGSTANHVVRQATCPVLTVRS
jgi:nucleotide-binding universal stress UspA family protein